MFGFSLFLTIILLISYLDESNKTPTQTRRRNMNIFGASKVAPPPVLWYQKNFPPFLDYDQDGRWFPC
jgi:hypothetical protein